MSQAKRAQTPKRKPQGRRVRRRSRLSPEQRARTKTILRGRRVGVISTAALLACGALVGLLFFARPAVSEVEHRALTAFPALSWDAFWSGSFFSDLALWFSDTYPVREQLVSANQAVERMHGITTQTQMVGGTKQADELPTDETPRDSAKDSKKDKGPVEVPTTEEMAAAIQDQITDGLYVKGDTAYNVYYFSQEAVDEYADAINALADAVDGQAQVYSMVVPNASGIMLSDQEVKDLGGTNQVEAIRYFYSRYNDKVRSVDTVAQLKQHTDEYIYFRTDHHWSTLGSYYGYVAFCETKGVKPESLDSMRYKNMGDFLGSFYSQLNSEAMAANPDYMEAWYPNATNELTLYDTDGTTSTYEIVADTSNLGVFEKSMTHIAGDQPLEKIENPKLSDGSSVLVIKDSFADSFVPFLVDGYQTVWVADFRYFEGNYADFIRKNNVKDVIVLNNISLAGGGVVGPSILGRL